MSGASTSNPIFDSLAFLLEPELAVLIAILLLLLAFMSFSGRKGKLAQARWAGTTEKLAALNIAMKQLKKRQHNQVCLYLGTPKARISLHKIPKSLSWKKRFLLHSQNFWSANSARLFTLLGTPPTYLIPSAERGISICGSPGSGKTFSAVDPAIRSAIDQELSIILYDVKGEQMKRHAAYAAAQGYQVYVFAPGEPYSGCINLLDFLTDEGDSTMAREIANVINRNARAHSSKPDEFFGPAGDQLIELVLMLAKGSIHPDLLMAWKILSLPKLAKRLVSASSMYSLDLWAEVSATSIMSVAEAERTVSGIVGTAVITFSQFVKRDFLPSIVGETTIPLKLDGKQLLIFQTDEKRESVATPLVAAVLHTMVKNNMNNQTKRHRPLALFIDEFPSIYLPDLESWINRFREYGLVTVLGYQNQSQLKKKYGEHDADSIIAACSTKLIFNPSHETTAAQWSRYLGEKEERIHTRSRSHGKHYSHSRSEQYHRIPLFSGDSINTMKEGECILLNTAYRGRGRAGVPWHIEQVKIPKQDILAQEKSTDLWETKVRSRLETRAKKSQLNLDEQQLLAELLQRAEIADWLLPDPKEVEAEKNAESEEEIQSC